MYRVLLTLFSAAYGANILASFPYPSYSHQSIYQPIWKELALRGHQVTVITPNPLKESIPNLRQIDLHDISYNVWDKYNISSLGVSKEVDSTDMSAFINVAIELQEVQLSNLEVQELVKNYRQQSFDLLITEPLPHVTPLKFVYNCPMIMILPTPLHFNMDALAGNPNHPIVNPDLNLPFSRNLNFFQRVQSVVNSMMMPLLSLLYTLYLQDGVFKHYGRNMNQDDFSEATLIFTNTNPVLHPPKPNIPSIIEFSGIHITPEKKLSSDLQHMLDKATQGVIYVSFGSNVKSSMMSQTAIQMFLNSFADMPYQVLWKFEVEHLDKKPNNVELRKWFPQQDVLRHKNVKLFITQGGLLSLDEAMYTKTPVLVIPFFGDQHGNARKVVDIGMGKFLNYFSLNEDILKTTISEIITQRYDKRSEELFDIVTDQPTTALDKVIWWTEYVLRHKNLGHMKSTALNVPFYQYYLLDVLTFACITVFTVLYILYIICKNILLRIISTDNMVLISDSYRLRGVAKLIIYACMYIFICCYYIYMCIYSLLHYSRKLLVLICLILCIIMYNKVY